MPYSHSLLRAALFMMAPMPLYKHTGLNHVEPPPELPPGCNDFLVIEGNPLIASTVILGEQHQVCDQARRLCSESILNFRKAQSEKITTKDTTVLFEEYGNDFSFPCEERGFKGLSEDCRGWNFSEKEHHKIRHLAMKENVIRNLLQRFRTEKIGMPSDTPGARQTAQADFLKRCMEQGRTAVLAAESHYKIYLEKYGKKNSDMGSVWKYEIEIAQFRQHKLKIILNRIEKGETFVAAVNDMVKEGMAYKATYEAFVTDFKASFLASNEAMFDAIVEANKRKKLTFVYAGNGHVDIHIKHRDLGFETEQYTAGVQALYDNLDKFAEKNPYAVLSCTIE